LQEDNGSSWLPVGPAKNNFSKVRILSETRTPTKIVRASTQRP
jgi:hypothetical protein